MDTIIPQFVIVSPITWDIHTEIQQATQGAAPTACPANRCYVPDALWGRIIMLAHTSPATGNPGVKHTPH